MEALDHVSASPTRSHISELYKIWSLHAFDHIVTHLHGGINHKGPFSPWVNTEFVTTLILLRNQGTEVQGVHISDLTVLRTIHKEEFQ